MKEKIIKILKFFRGLQLVVAFLFAVGICVRFSIAYAMPLEPSEEEREAMRAEMESMTDEERAEFMNERKGEMNGLKKPKEQDESIKSFSDGDVSAKKNDEKDKQMEEWIDVAKGRLNRNQTKLNIVKNLAKSAIFQMQTEGTDVKKIEEHLQTLENKITEIENLYSDYLNKLILFRDKKGDDPGKPTELINNARIKKTELVDFYKNTFRSSLEEALIQNEKEKL